MLKISRFLARNWNLCYFGLFLPKFGCHGNYLNSVENSGSIFEFTKPIQPYWTCEKFFDFLQETEICAILAYICLNLVAMATPLVPSKIEIAYLNSPTQYPDFLCEKFLDFLHRTEISAILAYFCSNLVAMATHLAPLKILIAYWNSPAPKSPPQLYMR